MREMGVTHQAIVEKLKERCVIDEVTGEMFISKKDARWVLGRLLKYRRFYQVGIIRELEECGAVEIVNKQLMKIK